MHSYHTVDPALTSTAAFHHYLLGAIAPRPIAFASTVDAAGQVNLSPFSFFNAFGANPPTLIFSPARRVRDNTTKHTHQNVLEVPEVVIHIVDYKMVEQMSLSSCEYPKEVNEFEKAGFTPIPSTKVKPPRVAEAPAAFECVVKQVIETGKEGGAGNLILCEVVLAHFQHTILDANQKIDTTLLDAVGRMGGDWYVRAHGNALFEVEKPNTRLGIGFDHLPHEVRNSAILTGNHLGKLANIEALPDAPKVTAFKESMGKQLIVHSPASRHEIAAGLLNEGKVEEAWLWLLA
jgi:flavin reductase (DIM6/NTAB) family NADH-FMN oxidoreductase RutF